jgi:L-asparaginase II
MNNNPVLVEVMRGGTLESFHRGVICVVNREGKVIFSRGDIEQVCFPRSALKYFQHFPLLESGAVENFGFTMEELALMCGSHNGEKAHVELVESILKKAGLDRSQLRCGPQYPALKDDVVKLHKADQPPHDIHNNCSGKHAGFLAACIYSGYSTDDYLDPAHPLQQQIMQVAGEMYEYPKAKMTVAIDGCSAPIFSIPVLNQALGYKNLVHPVQFSEKRRKACKMIEEAVSSYPFMVAGTHRYCTDMMQVCGERIIGKTGAEGVYCLSLRKEGIGCCIKIDDGKMLPQYNVAQKFIEATGIYREDELRSLRHYLAEPIRNYNKMETGEIRVVEGLFEGLTLN